MAYPDENIVQLWLNSLKGLPVCVKKMFGCSCLYCDGQPVGWLSENAFSLREVGLTDLSAEIKRPLPQDKIQEIVLPLDSYQAPWLPKVIQETANRRKK